MKKLIFSIIMGGAVLSMSAALTQNGYYRVRNYGSQRWAFLQDNKGSVDQVAGTADVHSLGLTLNTEKILTDPASIVYITAKGNSNYNIGAQGTSLQELMGYTVSIHQDGTTTDGEAAYRIYGTKSGVVKYMCDLRTIGGETGSAGLASGNDIILISYKKWAQWIITPVSVESDNFFGTVPTVEAEGKGYNVIYASFPFSLYSEGMKAYYIDRVAPGMVEMVEINGEIPAESPVIIECAGSEPEQNKMNVLAPSTSKLPANSLTGVYFDFTSTSATNQVKYDPETMRVLGTCADGTLGFITATGLTSIPSNSAYLKVEPGSPAEYKCLDSEKFTAGVDTVVQDDFNLTYSNGVVYSGKSVEIIVYNLSGQIVAKDTTRELNLSQLPKGVYIAKALGKSLKIMVN